MMRHISKVVLMVFLFILVSCHKQWDFEIDKTDEMSLKNEDMEILGVKFSPDYKDVLLDVDMSSFLSGKVLTDSNNIEFVVEEIRVNALSERFEIRRQPQLVQVQNMAAVTANNSMFKVLAIVDLTLPQPIVDEQRLALQDLKNIYGDEEIYVCFMYDSEVSETLPLTDYVLQHYFVSHKDSEKLLFRSIVEKRDEMRKPDGIFPLTNNQALLIFSDGDVYDENDIPYDPKHYEYKAELDKVYPELVRDTLSIYYVQVGTDWDGKDIEASVTLRRMCDNYDGLYQEGFDWHQMELDFKKKFDLVYCNYQFKLSNPDKKIYSGNTHTLFLKCYDKRDNSLLASDNISYTLGNAYEPVIVNGTNKLRIVLQGIFVVIIFFFSVYFIFQFVVPTIRYLYFLRHYVIDYKGKGMVINGKLVGDSCYLCRDNFSENDKIVVKCEHTMHKKCWDENEYKCPEYGRRCKTGSHYFNRKKLWDRKNASPYMIKLLIGGIAALGGWALFVFDISLIPLEFLNSIIQKINDVNSFDISSNSLFHDHQSLLRIIPNMGFCMGLFNMLFLGMLSVTHGNWKNRIGRLILLSIFCGICCWGFFFVECTVILIFGMTAHTYLIDWIPWLCSSLLLLSVLTWYIDKQLKKRAIVVSCLIGILTMNIWRIIFISIFIDYRLLLLLGFILYSITLALCVPHLTYKYTHSFLSISGSIKPVDVALYKWFKTSSKGNVTIGRSVDCDLQITWDIKGIVSPVHAEIRMQNGKCRLCPLEEGVFIKGKPCAIGKEYKLYHGLSFNIANTQFTYKEDL